MATLLCSRILHPMIFSILFTLFLFLLGLAFGSFLNVCIVRLPLDESIIKPRSRCPRCSTPLRKRDNIPLVSWLLLHGRCRFCEWQIPLHYPLVELAMGVYFALCGLHFGITVHALGAMILGFLLLGLMVMDWQTGLLADDFTLGGIFVGILVYIASVYALPEPRGSVILTAPEDAILVRMFAIAGAALVPLSIRWIYQKTRKREGLGLGDVKMLAMIAAFLGFWQTMLVLFLAIVAGALYAIGLLMAYRAGKSTEGSRGAIPLPFGVFLGLAGFYTVFWGSQTLAWYLMFFR
ncbi:MAG: prepilin peptidase [Acidobacteriaceae bacterium]